jgi:4-hydroxy-tetrahydrodipicolinate synthase
MRDAGLAVYVAGPGLGAAYLISPEERERIYAIAIEELKGRVPCRAGGREPNHAGQVLEFLQAAERAGMDAAQIYSLELGHAAKPNLAEMQAYYDTVIPATRLPVYLSCHHSSGYVPPVSLLESLADRYDNVAGIHYGGTDFKFLTNLIERFAGRLELHCAGVYNAATMLTLGANGFMGAESNIAPQLFGSVITTFDSGDMEAFRVAFGRLMSLYAVVSQYNGNSSSQRAVKPLMNALGLPGGAVRPPMLPIGDKDLAAMVKAVLALGIPEFAGIQPRI